MIMFQYLSLDVYQPHSSYTYYYDNALFFSQLPSHISTNMSSNKYSLQDIPSSQRCKYENCVKAESKYIVNVVKYIYLHKKWMSSFDKS